MTGMKRLLTAWIAALVLVPLAAAAQFPPGLTPGRKPIVPRFGGAKEPPLPPVYFPALSGRNLAGEEVSFPDQLAGQISIVFLTWSADQKTIATTGYIGPDSKLLRPSDDDKQALKPGFQILLWDVGSGKIRKRLGHFTESVYVAMTPDGKTVAATSLHQTTIWDVATGKQTHTLPGLSTATFSPDGRTFAAGKRLFLHGPGRPAVELPYSVVDALAFSPDSDLVAVSHRGYASFALWDLKQLRKK